MIKLLCFHSHFFCNPLQTLLIPKFTHYSIIAQTPPPEDYHCCCRNRGETLVEKVRNFCYPEFKSHEHNSLKATYIITLLQTSNTSHLNASEFSLYPFSVPTCCLSSRRDHSCIEIHQHSPFANLNTWIQSFL